MSSRPTNDQPRCLCGAAGPHAVADPALLPVLVRLAVVTLALRTLPFGLVGRWALGAHVAGRAGCPRCLSDRVSRASVPILLRGSCLSRSLVLARLLRRHGEDASVAIGVTGAGEQFTAHAWVELGGRPFGPDGDHAARYHILCRLTGADPVAAGSSRGGP